MYRYLTLLCAMLFVCAGVALGAGATTHTRTLNIKGTGATAAPSAVDTTSGACNISPWVHVCSGTNCTCVEVTVSNASGSMDKGKQTVSNFFVTADGDINPATAPDSSNIGPSCNPLRGVLTDTVASTGETKTINLLATSCKKITGISSGNPSGNHVGDTFSGGWGIEASPAPSPAASGWGTLSGTTTKTTGAVSFKLSGLVNE